MGQKKNTEDDGGFELESGWCGADPITKQGRRIQLAQMMVLPLIPAAVLIFQCIFGLIVTIGERSHVLRFEEELRYDKEVAILSNQLHKEWMNVTWYFLTVEDRDHQQKRQLEEVFNYTMAAVHDLEVTIETNNYLALFAQIRQQEQLMKENLLDFHRQVLNDSKDADDARQFYENVLVNLQNEVFALDRQDVGEDPHWKKLAAMQTLLKVRNNLGIEHFLGQKYYYGETFHVRDYNNFVGSSYVTDEGIKIAGDYYFPIKQLYNSTSWYTCDLRDAIEVMIKQILAFAEEEERPDDITLAIKWSDNMTTYGQILETIELEVAKDIELQVEEEKQSIAAEISASIVVLVFVAISVPLILAFIYRTAKTIQKQVTAMSNTDRQLRKEKKKSDTVLYQMLPKSVALQMKKNLRVAPEVYNSVTLLFSDIVGFTSLSAKSSPMQVVAFLNDLYYTFDTIIDRHDVYKVETIGDAYMIASGLPQRNGKNHAGQIGTMALELLKSTETFVIPHLPAEQIKMRVGLHSGPVVAGVVGTKMPRYCLFGETVDIASLMESSGVAMKIQVSDACHSILEELGGFYMERRGVFTIKGKETETYFLMERIGSYNGSRANTRLGLASRMQVIQLLNFTSLDDEKET